MKQKLIPICVAVMLTACASHAAKPPTKAEAKPEHHAAVAELAGASTAELEQKVAAGDIKAHVELGARYGLGRGVPVDYGKAFKLTLYAAEHGDAEAQFFVGTDYFNGAGVPKDESIAVVWYDKAADQHYALADYWMGFMIAYGHGGIPKSWNNAIPYFWDAAVQNDAMSAFLLGFAYSKGDDVEHNMRAAAYWYRRANTISPNVQALYNLRLLIETGAVAWEPGDPGDPPGITPVKTIGDTAKDTTHTDAK